MVQEKDDKNFKSFRFKGALSFRNAPYKNLNIVILLLLKALKQVHYNSNTPPSGGGCN